jgi:hypothetical protein
MTDASGAAGSGQGTGGGSDAGQAQGAQAQAGGAAFGAAADQGAQGAQTTTGQENGQQAQGQQAQASEGEAALAQRFPGFASWPEEARQALLKRDGEARNYQREAGDQRINAKNQAAADGARKALAEAAKLAGLDIPGLTDAEEGTGDPKALAEQITTVTGERDTSLRDAAAYRAALRALMPGDDAAKDDALEFLAFKLGRDATYKGDPTESDYAAKIGATVTTLVAADPRFRPAGTGTVASGVESLGGSQASGQITSEQFGKMSLGERQQLRNTDPETYQRLISA